MITASKNMITQFIPGSRGYREWQGFNVIKTYLVKWNTSKLCMCRHKAVNSDKITCAEPFNVGRDCKGNLNDRPEWCPLIEAVHNTTFNAKNG